MLTKMLIAEGLLVTGMLVTFLHQQLPDTRIIVGETEVVVKADRGPAATAVTELPVAHPVAVRGNADLVFPVSGHDPSAVISVFGDKRGAARTHEGIDIKAPHGTPVVAVTDGFVERIREGGNGGRQLYLRDARGRLYYYAHLADWAVGEYDAVSAGDVLGSVGKTGNARNTTPHLHFEVLVGKGREAVDPLRFWIKA